MYLIGEFEERLMREEAYNKVLTIIKEGGKIFLGSTPKIDGL